MFSKRVAAPVPRWQWRTFAPDLAPVRSRLAEVAKAKPRHSRETYFVSELVPHSVAVRFDELDVKRLVQVDAHGLQLWDPVLHAVFPITAEVAARLFAIWRVPLPGFEREHYSLTLFLQEVVSRNRDVHLAEVEKTACSFVYEGCAAELVQVAVNGMPLESFCLEHEHESAVLGAMADLGLSGGRNVSYPQAIKDLLGLSMLPAPA